jgi:hypothetical protein
MYSSCHIFILDTSDLKKSFVLIADLLLFKTLHAQNRGAILHLTNSRNHVANTIST